MANPFTDANGKASVTAQYIGSDGRVSETVESEDKQMSITVQLPNEDNARLGIDVDEDGDVDIYLLNEPEDTCVRALKPDDDADTATLLHQLRRNTPATLIAAGEYDNDDLS